MKHEPTAILSCLQTAGKGPLGMAVPEAAGGRTQAHFSVLRWLGPEAAGAAGCTNDGILLSRQKERILPFAILIANLIANQNKSVRGIQIP